VLTTARIVSLRRHLGYSLFTCQKFYLAHACAAID
jgi:hypothetical protein